MDVKTGRDDISYEDGNLVVFTDLVFTAKFEYKIWNRFRKSSENTNDILRGASGALRPGRMTFVLGPSGAGKTTLMKILAGRKKIGITGSLYGTSRSFVLVAQDTSLIDTLTAGETMKFAASLKLPNMSHRERSNVIKTVTKQLGIHEVLHTRAGRLSGGERKRLTIACELLTDPTTMLLDEPTRYLRGGNIALDTSIKKPTKSQTIIDSINGLDAVSSLAVIRALVTVARSGRTVACVIHQPSSQLFSMADDVIVLANGRTLYGGTVADIPNALSRAGFVCPQYYNVADYLLEIASDGHSGNKNLLESEANYYAQEMKRIARNDIQFGNPRDLSPESEALLSSSHVVREGYSASPMQQLNALLWRCTITSIRDVHLTQLRLICHLIVALLLGALYNGAGEDGGRVMSNTGCLFFFLLFIFFSNAMPTIHTFPQEAKVILQEHLNKWYSLAAYSTSKIIVDLPVQLLCATVFFFPAWYLTSQPLDGYRMGLGWFICALVTILAQTFGLVTGAAFGMKLGLFVVPAANIPMLMFSEFFIPYAEMPVYLQPFALISYFRYAFAALLETVYGFNRGKLPCEKIFCMFKLPESYFEHLQMSRNINADFLALVLWIIFLQILLIVVMKIRVFRACR